MQVGICDASGAATCFLFDLIGSAPAQRPAVVEQLAAILRAPTTVKVLLDKTRLLALVLATSCACSPATCSQYNHNGTCMDHAHPLARCAHLLLRSSCLRKCSEHLS